MKKIKNNKTLFSLIFLVFIFMLSGLGAALCGEYITSNLIQIGMYGSGFLAWLWFFLRFPSLRWYWVFLSFVLLGLEILGEKTGFPYGDFSYTQLTKPHIFSVPLSIFFVWPSLVLASSQFFINKWKNIFISGLVLVLFDLIMDPAASYEMSLWSWGNYSGWYGVPLSNFFGWFLLGSLGSFILSLFYREEKKPSLKDWFFLRSTLILNTVFWVIYSGVIISPVMFVLGGVLIRIFIYDFQNKFSK